MWTIGDKKYGTRGEALRAAKKTIKEKGGSVILTSPNGYKTTIENHETKQI